MTSSEQDALITRLKADLLAGDELATRRRAARPTGGAMTPDLPTRVREAFEEVRGAAWQRHEDGTDEALAVVIAVVQEDRTREIVEWAMRNAASMKRTGNTGPADRWESTANAITREFGGTHD